MPQHYLAHAIHGIAVGIRVHHTMLFKIDVQKKRDFIIIMAKRNQTEWRWTIKCGFVSEYYIWFRIVECEWKKTPNSTYKRYKQIAQCRSVYHVICFIFVFSICHLCSTICIRLCVCLSLRLDNRKWYATLFGTYIFFFDWEQHKNKVKSWPRTVLFHSILCDIFVSSSTCVYNIIYYKKKDQHQHPSQWETNKTEWKFVLFFWR